MVAEKPQLPCETSEVGRLVEEQLGRVERLVDE
jgi:hypothetical protein